MELLQSGGMCGLLKPLVAKFDSLFRGFSFCGT